MTVSAAAFSDTSGNVVTATVDDVIWHGVKLDADGEMPGKVKEWIAAGNAPAPYAAPPAPPAAFTPPQIIAALEGWGVADQVLAGAAPLLLAKFYTARALAETDERLTTMLTGIGKTIADLEAAVAPA